MRGVRESEQLIRDIGKLLKLSLALELLVFMARARVRKYAFNRPNV